MRLTDTAQFKTGKDVERFLDRYFAGLGFDIQVLSAAEERVQHLGDRRFTRDGRSMLIEYKSGIQTFYTGNVFLETISVDAANAPGWVYTSRANWIVYACVLNHKLLWFQPETLRAKIDNLKARYKTVPTSKGQNAGYNTHGVIVPLQIAERELAHTVTLLPVAYPLHPEAL